MTTRCACGATFTDDEVSDASCVAYSLPALAALESRIAVSIEAYLATETNTARAAWLASHFVGGYPNDEPRQAVIEDIVIRELNDGFTALFRCPACGRILLCDPATNIWTSYYPEPGESA
jgi:hypothetical protein